MNFCDEGGEAAHVNEETARKSAFSKGTKNGFYRIFFSGFATSEIAGPSSRDIAIEPMTEP